MPQISDARFISPTDTKSGGRRVSVSKNESHIRHTFISVDLCDGGFLRVTEECPTEDKPVHKYGKTKLSD